MPSRLCSELTATGALLPLLLPPLLLLAPAAAVPAFPRVVVPPAAPDAPPTALSGVGVRSRPPLAGGGHGSGCLSKSGPANPRCPAEPGTKWSASQEGTSRVPRGRSRRSAASIDVSCSAGSARANSSEKCPESMPARRSR